MMETGNLKIKAPLKRNTKGLKICEQGILLFCHSKDVWDNSKNNRNSLQIEYAGSVGKHKSVGVFAVERKREGQILPACFGRP